MYKLSFAYRWQMFRNQLNWFTYPENDVTCLHFALIKKKKTNFKTLAYYYLEGFKFLHLMFYLEGSKFY